MLLTEYGRDPYVGLRKSGSRTTGHWPRTQSEQGVLVREIVDAAFAFPAVAFTAPLIVAVGFWLLVLLGWKPEGFTNVDNTEVVGAGVVPVMAVASLTTGLVWVCSLVGSVLVRRVEVPGSLYAVLTVAVPIVSLTLGYLMAGVVLWARRPDIQPEP